jgi:hypothetical protein
MPSFKQWWIGQMAQFKPRQGPKLPAPPALDVAPQNLRAPEIAPLAVADGRSLRATGRTKQLATRVREEFYDDLKLYAAKHHLKIVEVLEQGFKLLTEKKLEN